MNIVLKSLLAASIAFGGVLGQVSVGIPSEEVPPPAPTQAGEIAPFAAGLWYCIFVPNYPPCYK